MKKPISILASIFILISIVLAYKLTRENLRLQAEVTLWKEKYYECTVNEPHEIQPEEDAWKY